MSERSFDVEALNWLDEHLGKIRSEIEDAALAVAENNIVYVSDMQVAAHNHEQQLAAARAEVATLRGIVERFIRLIHADGDADINQEHYPILLDGIATEFDRLRDAEAEAAKVAGN